MAFKKQMYNWQRVKAGDIISFNYQSSRSTAKKNNCILVLNPKLPVVRKDGTNSFHLTGIKLKENQKPRVRFNTGTVRILERIGKWIAVNYDDDVFKLEVDKQFIISEIKGVKTNGFNKITSSAIIRNNYRTYDWLKAKKSPVYLEWLKVSEKENYKPVEEIKEEKTTKKFEEKKIMKQDKTNTPKTGKQKPKTGKKQPNENK